MSSISVNTITDASGGATTSINGFTPSVSNMAGRNRIINGGFDVWQRGTSFNVNATGTTATYVADRWCLFPANTGFTAVAQAVQISGGGLRINCSTAASYATTADVLSLQQRIEGYNCSDLSGKQVTVSFKLKTNKTGNYGVTLYAADTSTWGTPQSITVGTADVETTYTLTFTAQSGIVAAATEGLRLVVCLAANTARAGVYYPTGGSQVNLLDNTSNYLELKQVQLEEGSVATPFEHRQYGQELALCQRYFEMFGDGCPLSLQTSTSYQLSARFLVEKRATPTFIHVTNYGVVCAGNGQTITSLLSTNTATTKGCVLNVVPNNFIGVTAGQAAYVSSSNDGLSASSEL